VPGGASHRASVGGRRADGADYLRNGGGQVSGRYCDVTARAGQVVGGGGRVADEPRRLAAAPIHLRGGGGCVTERATGSAAGGASWLLESNRLTLGGGRLVGVYGRRVGVGSCRSRRNTSRGLPLGSPDRSARCSLRCVIPPLQWRSSSRTLFSVGTELCRQEHDILRRSGDPRVASLTEGLASKVTTDERTKHIRLNQSGLMPAALFVGHPSQIA
jgi:hypothetical protein